MGGGPCAKCGSKDVAGGIRLMDRGDSNADAGNLALRTHTNPSAWLFKGKVSSPLSARVCGACGYVELYVDDPRAILEAARKAEADDRGLE